MVRMNPELLNLLYPPGVEMTQYQQVRILDTALTPNKRIKAKRVANAATAQADVWSTGTLFRDAALLGGFTFSRAEITSYGVTSDLTTHLAADLSTGKSVLRIEGGGHWVELTLGLPGSGADATLPSNPTATSSIAFAATFRLRANQSLPDGTPDLDAPVAALVPSSNLMTAGGDLTLIAEVSDDMAVTKVELYSDGVLRQTKNQAPWEFVEPINFTANGYPAFTCKAYDATGKSGISPPSVVNVDIPPPPETGIAVAVGAVLTDIKIESTSASAQTNVPVTFGQVFAVGALPSSNAAVDLRAPNNSIVTCQLDVKATHPDGSVRHALLSAIIPALAGSASVTYAIVRRAAPPTGTPAVPSDFSGLTASVVIAETGTNISGPVTGVTYTADAGPALAAGTYETWLSGPVVSEWIVRVPFKTSGGVSHPEKEALIYVQAYKGQAKARIRHVVESNLLKRKTVPSGNSPFVTPTYGVNIYSVALKVGTSTVFSRSAKGYHQVKLDGSDLFDGNASLIPNTSTAYTATITVNGVAKAISIVGSAAQTYGELKALLNTQLGGTAICELNNGFRGLTFVATAPGPTSSVVISNYGTLFPALRQVGQQRPIRGDEVMHYQFARWTKTFWWGTAPQVHIAHNKTYLMASKAVPNYDPTLTGSTTEIAAMQATMAQNNDFNYAGITKAYMREQGYAPGIGLLPSWCAMWVINQGKAIKDLMLEQADLAGGWPVHRRDQVTGLPMSFMDWPMAALLGSDSDAVNPSTGLTEKLPDLGVPAGIFPTFLEPETAHCPDFYFAPYLATGDHFYLEGMLFYQRWMCAGQNPASDRRNGNKCLIIDEQPRGQAWMLRSTVHALYLIPDNHPLRAELAYTVEQNRLWYNTNYVNPNGAYHNFFGVTVHGYALTPYGGGGLAPWQDDFITAAVGRAIELGHREFLPLMKFKSKFLVGRFTSGTDYCWQVGAGVMAIALRSGFGQPLYTSYKQAFDSTFTPAIKAAQCGTRAMQDALLAAQSEGMFEGVRNTVGSMPGYPDTVGGYAANAQPAIAYCVTHGMPKAEDVETVFEGRSEKPNYNLGPQFAIVPRTQG